MSIKSDLLNDLTQRGYVKQITDETALDAYFTADRPIAYIGFDATARSLHVGSLVQIMMLRHLQKHGGKPIVLMGGGTTKIGDPSDKDKARPILSEADIAANMDGIGQAFAKFLKFGDGPCDAIMVNNADWLDGLGYIEFLREFGRHFTINTMVKFESVRRRLDNDQPYSFLEFNYMLLQAYDFLELNRRYDCRLQMGGSEQWGNIINGMELCRRVDAKSVFGLTAHLITTASGAKMGKTASGAVWLNADMRSPFEYWQFWRNCEDADTGRFLRLFTELPLDEIARLEALEGAEINAAKIILANAATTMLHGEAAAQAAERAAQAVFAEGQSAAAVPTISIDQSALDAGIEALEGFVRAGLAQSKSEVRRHIKAGAAKINGDRLDDDARRLSMKDVDADGAIRLSIGKKRHAQIRPG